MVYDRRGIDIWEVLDAAATKPFGFMRNPVDDDLVLRTAPLVVDTRGVFRGRDGNVVEA